MNPVALLLGGWRYLAGVALVAGGYLWLTTAAYDRGVRHERGIWAVRTARVASIGAAAAATLAASRQTRAETADSDHAARAQRYAVRQAPIIQEIVRYVATPAAAFRCPDLRGVQLGTGAIAAANAALAAAR